MKKNWIILQIFLPLLVVFGWTTYLYLVSENASDVEFPVRGYDPRDLLSGNYIRYQVDYGSLTICNERESTNVSDKFCVCFEKQKNSRFSVASSRIGCEQAKDLCGTYMRGNCQYGEFIAGIERFFIPEEYKNYLTTIPENSSIIVRIPKNGHAMLHELLIEGKNLREFVFGK